MRRPLIELSLLMWMIIFVTAQINIDILRLGGLGLVLAGLFWWAVCYKKGSQSYKCKVFICLVLVLVLFMELVNIQFLKVEALETMEGEYEAVGIVTDIRAHKTTIKNVKAYERSGLQDTSGKRLPKLLVKHKWGMKADWKVGDEVRVYGYISKFDEARNPKTFSPRNFYNGQGIPLYLNVEEKGGLVTSKDTVLAAVEEIRGRLVGKMDILLSEEDSALLKGIMLGEDDSIDDQTLEGFRLTGTAHILAVSGLHFGILYMFLSKLLIQIKCPYKGALAISCLVMLVFVVLTGMSFSAIRAFGMICIHMLAVFTKRKYDLLNALGLVALISMLACPYIIWQVGFQLSFWAVFCIGSFMKLKIYAQTHVTYVKLERLELLIFPLYIQGMLTPLMVFHFNRLNLYGPFFNIPTAILMPFVLLTGVYFLLMGGFPLVVICNSRKLLLTCCVRLMPR